MSDEVQRASDRIERLLGELRASLSPTAWPKVEELLATVTSVYGLGLSRMLETLAERGAIDEETRAVFCEDPLIASLLVLHGLHPVPTVDRVRAAVERVSRASHPAKLEVVDTSTVRATGHFAKPRAEVESMLTRTLAQLAPDAPPIALVGDATFASELVQLRVQREAPR